MKLAIMQPYLFPYLGYFQLIHAVDEFVIYDDVNYIKGGWINRNYISSNNIRQLITLPLQGASPNKLINQISINKQHKILQNIRHSYSKAPLFDIIYPIIEDILTKDETNLATLIDYQLRTICQYLNINPKWHTSSKLHKDNELRGQEKIISICKELGASHYINAQGGQTLYDQESFLKEGRKISFIHPKVITYPQFGTKFIPNLSIIDVMMFNNLAQCKKLLNEYEIK